MAVVLPFIGGCDEGDDDDDTVAGEPFLWASPIELDFGDLDPGDESTLNVSIGNGGDATLSISEITVNASPSYTVQDGHTDRTLDAGEATTMGVVFAPTGYEDSVGTIHIMSNDPTNPDYGISVEGRGLAPSIVLDPALFDFGEVAIDTQEWEIITIRNAGTATLIIEGIEVESMSGEFTGSWSFPKGTEVEPNQTETVSISYLPVDEGLDTATLGVTSNDPLRPESWATLQGTGVAAR